MKKSYRQPNEPEILITSKKSVIEWLKPVLKVIDNPNDIKAIEIILNEIGKCTVCKGTGENLHVFPPDNNYKVKFYPRGGKMYAVSCILCKGSGHILETQCVSCGIKADIMPSQRHFEYCETCEKKLTLTGILK